MQNEITVSVFFGFISSVLLAVVAYFIRQLHSDFKKMELDLNEVKTMALIIKTEFKNSYDLMNQKVEYLEQRINKLELNQIKIQKMKSRNLNLVSRVQEPTPKWFRIVRNIGLALSAVGGVLVAAPVALPAAVVSVGGYLLLGGTIIGAVSQTAVSAEEYGDKNRKSRENSTENSSAASEK